MLHLIAFIYCNNFDTLYIGHPVYMHSTPRTRSSVVVQSFLFLVFSSGRWSGNVLATRLSKLDDIVVYVSMTFRRTMRESNVIIIKIQVRANAQVKCAIARECCSLDCRSKIVYVCFVRNYFRLSSIAI